MATIASTQAVPEPAQGVGATSSTAVHTVRPIRVRRFSPSSIAAVLVSFLAFTGLTVGAAAVIGTVVTKVIKLFASL